MRINTFNPSPQVSLLFHQMKTHASSSISLFSNVETSEFRAKFLCDGSSEVFLICCLPLKVKVR